MFWDFVIDEGKLEPSLKGKAKHLRSADTQSRSCEERPSSLAVFKCADEGVNISSHVVVAGTRISVVVFVQETISIAFRVSGMREKCSRHTFTDLVVVEIEGKFFVAFSKGWRSEHKEHKCQQDSSHAVLQLKGTIAITYTTPLSILCK